MELRDKLIDILVKVNKECDLLESVQPYPCEGCKYRNVDRRIHGCIFEKFADAIIESGLVVNVNNEYTCKDCKYFLGGGDWNLCCSKPHEDEGWMGWLCYEDTQACDEFEEKENA